MDPNLTYHTDLISRYFAGEASPEEIQHLSGWVSEETAHRRLFEEYHKTWLLLEQSKIGSSLNIDSEWNQLASLISFEPLKSEPKILPFKGKEKKAGSGILNAWRIAAGFAVLAVLSAVLFYFFSGPRMVILTANNGNLEKVLPDGSVVTLNKGSILEYPTRFASGTREIKLTGEAYFNVAHDRTKPFVVSVDEARIQVLGTAFNVNTNAGDGKMTVVLTTGRISLYFSDNPSETLVLQPGEKAEISKTERKINRNLNADPNYMSWKTGMLVFENAPLEQVVNSLNNTYHCSIRFADNNIKNCRLTASFDRQPLTSVLNVLKGTLDLHLAEKGSSIELSGKPCQ